MIRPVALALSLVPFALVAQAPAEAPLSLDDAVRSALEAQPGLKAAEARAQAAEARQSQAGWDRVGRLDTTLLYTPEQKPFSATFPGIPPLIPPATFEIKTLNTWSLQAAYTQPLWTWRALELKHESAKLDADASRQSLARTRQQTAFDASRAFLQAAQAEEAVKVAEQALEQQRAFLKVATSRFEAGSAPKLDKLKADLAVAKAESDLLETRNRARLAREALVTATTDPRFRTSSLKPMADALPDLPEEEAAVKRALERRADLQGLQRQEEALTKGSRAAKAAGLPALSFRAAVTQQNDQASKIFEKQGQTYQVGLALTWEGFSPWRNRARAAELRATAESVRHQEKAAEEGVALEVRSAVLSAREARERAQVQSRAVGVAEEQARIARLAYQEGVITSVEEQQAELALSAARFDKLRADLDAALAWSTLRFSMGE